MPVSAKGRRGGRPPALDVAKRELCTRLYAEGRYGVAELCRMMGISKPTLYAYVKRAAQRPEDTARRTPPGARPESSWSRLVS